VEQAVTVGKRLAGAMVRFFEHEGRASGDLPLLAQCH